MLEHGKMHPIKISFIGPYENQEKAINALIKLGFRKEDDPDDFIPLEEAFSEYSKDETPGVILTGARGKEGLTQKQLSELTGIPQGHISKMENGKKAIGVKIAKKIGKVLNVNYRLFL
jgi:DNA-binding XRE family transcriptional regulator